MPPRVIHYLAGNKLEELSYLNQVMTHGQNLIHHHESYCKNSVSIKLKFNLPVKGEEK